MILDIFSDDIFDYLDSNSLNNIVKVYPSIVRLYKSSYIDTCLSFCNNMYVECSYCGNITNGKRRKCSYVCNDCLVSIITLPLE